MSDQMKFPETWEEFEKQYGFYDIKRAYVFGNIRLIPSFRVQQWLNHLDDINCKKQSQKNKMEVIAALFGKELGEEFEVKLFSNIIKSRFTEFGIEEHFFKSEWFLDGELLQMLLTGEAVIVNE